PDRESGCRQRDADDLARRRDFVVANHPVLFGVDSFNGEGVSAITVPDVPPAGVTINRIVAMRGKVRNNDGIDPAAQFEGTLRNATAKDASLVLANAGRGRVAAYFDRNSFFNANGL